MVVVFLSSPKTTNTARSPTKLLLVEAKRGLGFFLEEASLWPYGVGC